MKTAHEILLEAVHLKDSAVPCESGKILEIIADLARIVVELEHQHGSAKTAELPESEPAASH